MFVQSLPNSICGYGVKEVECEIPAEDDLPCKSNTHSIVQLFDKTPILVLYSFIILQYIT